MRSVIIKFFILLIINKSVDYSSTSYASIKFKLGNIPLYFPLINISFTSPS